MNHRYLTDNELDRISVEKDMIQGNINRMCVTDDIDELIKMYGYANSRIDKIFNICIHKFTDVMEDKNNG